MRKNSFRGKRFMDGEWVDGSLFIDAKKDKHEILLGYVNYRVGWEIDPETVGQFTGVFDTELLPVYEGDIVRFIDYVGKIEFYSGCFGIAINGMIDWDHIDEEMEEYAGTNQLTACLNDNFISLWEILWNFNCEENTCNVIEVIGNIHDNPELLGGAENG